MNEVAYPLPSVMAQPPAGPRTSAPPPPGRGSRLTERVPVAEGRWQERAGCRGQGNSPTSVWMAPWLHPWTAIREARRTCWRCPVFDKCEAADIRVGVCAARIWVVDPRGRLVAVEPRECAMCGTRFVGKSPKARMCSKACRDEANRNRPRGLNVKADR